MQGTLAITSSLRYCARSPRADVLELRGGYFRMRLITGDGEHRDYLRQKDEWRRFDADVFDNLNRIPERSVRALESANIIPSALYFDDVIPSDVKPYSLRPAKRTEWLMAAREKLDSCDLTFLDPDNGIASERLKLTQRKAGKSVTLDEIADLRKRGRAIVVYHHQTRWPGGRHDEIACLARRLRDRGLAVTGVLRAKPWSPRLLFIIDGDRELCEAAEGIAARWQGKISWHA